MSDNIRTMQYFATQSAEDLFRCKENGKIFARLPCADKSLVRWTTTKKWSGGYEPDCELREGLVIRVVDVAGNLLFEEHVIRNEWMEGTLSKKEGPFHYEAVKEMAREISSQMGLKAHSDWKKWLLAEKEACGNTDYDDNWLYAEATAHSILGLKFVYILGCPVRVMSTYMRHNLCGKVWECYELKDAYSTTLEILGYTWDDETE